jgi:hypothetical protein
VGADVIHGDLELFLTGWYRAAFADREEDYTVEVEFDRVEPPPGQPFPKRLVVIRDDGGNDTSVVTMERSVGITALAGTKEDPRDALNIVRMCLALATRIPGIEPGNPVAALVENSRTGPFLVPEEQPHARAYGTLSLVTFGQPL